MSIFMPLQFLQSLSPVQTAALVLCSPMIGFVVLVASLILLIHVIALKHTYPNDLPYRMLDLLRLLFKLKLKARMVQRVSSPPWSLNAEWRSRVDSTPDRPFLTLADSVGGGSSSYRDVDVASNAVAWAARTGMTLTSGSVVAILMPSRVEYVQLWLGFSKVGVTSALINTNLSNKPLIHAVSTALDKNKSGQKFLIVSEVLAANVTGNVAVMKALAEGGVEVLVYHHDTLRKDAANFVPKRGSFDYLLAAAAVLSAAAPEPEKGSTQKWSSDLFYIYTSGTTGFPKASRINHLRFFSAGAMLHTLGRVTSSDIIYCALPLYHSAGGMVGVSCCINSGASMVIRDKFSVSKLAEDIVMNKCTVLQYIGEFARFALSAGSKTGGGVLDKKCGEVSVMMMTTTTTTTTTTMTMTMKMNVCCLVYC